MAKIRPIVKAAFKVSELVEQFRNIDVPDGYLETGSIEEVNEKYDDAYLVGEAKHRLLLINDQLDCYDEEGHPEDWRVCMNDKRQLTNFIRKWG